MVTESAGRLEDEPDNFGIQRWPPQPFPLLSGNRQPGDRPLLDQGSFKLRHRHQDPELKLPDGIILRGIDALARADQGNVSHLKLADNDGEMRQAATQTIKLVGHDLMHASGPHVSQHGLESWASGGHARCGIPQNEWGLPSAHSAKLHHLVLLGIGFLLRGRNPEVYDGLIFGIHEEMRFASPEP